MEPQPSNKKNLYIIIAIALIAGGVWYFKRTPATPSVAEVTPKLQAYLLSPAANRSCAGTISLDTFSNVSVGEYSKDMGGYPIYATYKKTCKEGRTTTTYNSSNNETEKVAAIYARYGANKQLEFFVPAIFEQAGAQLQQNFDSQINEAFDNVQF